MPLVELRDVEDLLICPVCRSRMEIGPTEVLCSSAQCPRHEVSHGFPILRGQWPVLIDFEHSVVKPESFHSNEHATGRGSDSSELRQSLLKRIYSWFVRPENEVAASNVQRLDELVSAPEALVLVVGGGTKGNGLATLYAQNRFRILAFDIYPSADVQFISDAHRVPLADQSIDAVVVQAILEHVLDPQVVVDEIHRVLKIDGLVYAETPFMQQVHAGRYDFTRFSDSGHRWLFRNFEQIDRGIVAGPGTALLWSVDHFARSVFRSRSAGRLARLLFFWLRFGDRVADPAYGADAASAVYFLGRRSANPITPQDIVDDYSGGQRS